MAVLPGTNPVENLDFLDQRGIFFRVGDPRTVFGSTPPGWTPADGLTRRRASFPLLFQAYGTTYNTGGESAEEFRVPAISSGITGFTVVLRAK